MSMRGSSLCLVALFLASAGCEERVLFDGLPPTDGGWQRDARPVTDGGADGAADTGSDEWDVPLECEYPSDGYGYRAGDALDPFWLSTCEGERTSLPELWCEQEVTILHLNVAWCGSCMVSTHELLTEIMPEFEGEPVRLLEILLEDQPDMVADPEVCWWWNNYFSPNVTTYIPYDGELDGPLLWLASEDTLPLTIILDGDGVIRLLRGFDLPRDLIIRIREILDESS